MSLRMAGVSMKPAEYNAMRLVIGICTGMTGVVVMRYWLSSRIRKRKQAIQKQLPEVLDLLSVSVEAGLGFDAALQRISDRAKGPLIDELNATYREITLGRSRAEALRNFEARCGLEEVKSFVSSIIQAEQLGISLKNVLKSQAQQMRLLKRQKVEERAMKTPVKIILPLVGFVFPVLFIILLGPAIINIIGMKGLFGG
jgi:tight adherence protein C